ncbi:rRNA methyltransferase 2, mitochondrial-like [Haliotis rufescens]|uniref:rRNA methyltransferase 2, mitochondrial-like n=1 Tax=Haliotis rufescens TaxID=6454 RepID=UPI001EAF99B6|nr:rRNA methyltransferase 2, mitochondrial-like [Haliotis rufescens]
MLAKMPLFVAKSLAALRGSMASVITSALNISCTRCICGSAIYSKGKKISSQQWLIRQRKDPYVEKAAADNYRCRSAYKLLEIDDRHKLLHPGGVVIDCGAAPGSWTQVALERVKEHGQVISIDLQPMATIDKAVVLCKKDFTTPETQAEVKQHLSGRLADFVMSDMAPRASGVKSLDHDRIISLCVETVKFSCVVLREGGAVLCKLWQGAEQPRLEHIMKQLFKTVRVVKPDASRSDSAEIFLLGKNFTGKRPPQKS